MTNWLAYLFGIIAAFVFGGWFGWSLSQSRCHRHAARELARLRGLVPDPGWLRRLADLAQRQTWNWPETDDRHQLGLALARRVRDLAARIEAAGMGE